MLKMDDIRVIVDRFDGQRQYQSRYTVACEETMTLLELLEKIRREQDDTLTFTANCRSAVCGACAVEADRQAVLACSTRLRDLPLAAGVLYLRPLCNYKVIRDLVIDWESKLDRLKMIQPWLSTVEKDVTDAGLHQTHGELQRFNAEASCIFCGCCAARCSKLTADSTDYYEPYVYLKAGRLYYDSRQAGSTVQLRAVQAGGLWKCMHCHECTAACPQELSPAAMIARLRASAAALGDDCAGVRHATAFYHDINDYGRLNEPLLVVRTAGLLKSLQQVPRGLQLLRRGKLSLRPFPARIKGIRVVRRLLARLQQGRCRR